MALDALVDSAQLDADLTSVANAIRTKGGTNASLAFPADFVSAIAAIPSGGGTTGTLTFDFSKGLSSEEYPFIAFVLTNATQDSSGIHLSGANSIAKLGLALTPGCVFEVEVGAMTADFSSSNHARFISTGSDGSNGLIYRNTGYWALYGGSWIMSAEASPTFFANSTIRFELGTSVNKATIYKDDVAVFSDKSIGGTGSYVTFGATSAAYYTAVIKKCTIYSAEAYALKVLLGS